MGDVPDDDIVFKALADPHRRALLDALRERDGRTLGELCEPMPMTRYGVMKHLALLEEAGLVTTERVGREKHHYLNPIPIQMVYERWVSRFARPWAGALTALKRHVEQEEEMDKHVQMIFVQASAEEVWKAWTDPDLTPRYYFGSAVEGEWKEGGEYRYPRPYGGTYVDGRILEIEPPHKLVTTFTPHWEGAAAAAETRVTFLVEPQGEMCKITLIHEGLDTSQGIGADIAEGWARILSGMKTVLETGRPFPGQA